ncbi:hypothetical protein ACS0TY_017654 [Phlomoides rotata]
MAIFCKLCFFFLIMSSTCYQIQARESKFFSKYRHLSTTNYVTIPSTHPKVVVPFSSPSPSPSPITSHISGIPASAPAPATMIFGADYSPAPTPTTLGVDYSPTLAPTETDVPYYGLYAKETNDKKDEFSTEEFNNRESYTYNNGYPNSLSNNNGFWTSNHESYQNTNNGYKSEPQGMSDTRLQNDGKYYYARNPTGYKNSNEEGYYDAGNYKKSKYEFDSMEEYEKQEGFADVEQEFIP